MRPTVPARSKIPVKIELYKADISYPYEFKADVSYDLTLSGFLRWAAMLGIPIRTTARTGTTPSSSRRTRTRRAAFVTSGTSVISRVKWWDWNWTIGEYGLTTVQNNLGRVLLPTHSAVIGDVYAESQFAGDIEIGLP